MAGVTLAAVGVPEVMGYTKIIETPVITGLYTMFLPIVAFAIFGSSRHLVVGADSEGGSFPNPAWRAVHSTINGAYDLSLRPAILFPASLVPKKDIVVSGR